MIDPFSGLFWKIQPRLNSLQTFSVNRMQTQALQRIWLIQRLHIAANLEKSAAPEAQDATT